MSETAHAHATTIDRRVGTRRSFDAWFYRWVCLCEGERGRWTRQYDTAMEGGRRHVARVSGRPS